MLQFKCVMKKCLPYFCFVLGVICFCLTGGRFNIIFCAWLFPVLLLLFSDAKKINKLVRIVMLIIGIQISSILKHYGIISSGRYYLVKYDILVLILYGLLFSLPFVFHILLTPKIKNRLLKILFFPCCWTALEFIMSRAIGGTLSSISSSQFAFSPFIQFSSAVGALGITFFICFFASALENAIITLCFSKTLICTLVVAVLIILFGFVRLITSPEPIGKVIVASITRTYGHSQFDDSYDAFTEEQFNQVLYHLEDDISKANEEGADVVLWFEECFLLWHEKVEEFTEYAGLLAKKYSIALIVPMEIGFEEGYYWNNCLVAINKNGEIEYRYDKTFLVPVLESFIMKGDGKIKSFEVENTKISSVICFDASYPSFIRKCSHEGVQLLLSPAWDWDLIAEYACRPMIVRGIENGFSSVRNAYHGILMAIDPYGRVITEAKTDNVGSDVIVSEMPIYNVTTIYGKVGDVIPVFCLIYVLITSVYVICLKIKQHRNDMLRKKGDTF